MDFSERFRILHTPKSIGKFEDFILKDCCAEDKFISENNGSFSFDAYIGCTNGCTYCYMNRKPYCEFINNKSLKIKSSLLDTEKGRDQIISEVDSKLIELRNHGLMASFVTDPFLPEVLPTTLFLMDLCSKKGISLKVLTKRTDWINKVNLENMHEWKKYISIGFTLTNVDKIETNASPNEERIKAIEYLNNIGYVTFCSIEPIINCEASYFAIYKTFGKCAYYKIGIDSMRKYDSAEMRLFIDRLVLLYMSYTNHISNNSHFPYIYLKNNILDVAEIAETDFENYIKHVTELHNYI